MKYDINKIYEIKNFESLPPVELRDLFRNVKLMLDIQYEAKKIKKGLADVALMRQVIKGFSQIHNSRELL